VDGDHPNGGTITPKLVDGDEIKRERQGRKYIVVTREYMAQGHDGFLSLKGSKYLIDDEVGKMYSTLVRQYLLGFHYVNKMVRLNHEPRTVHLHKDTKAIVGKERERRERHGDNTPSTATRQWQHAATLALRSKSHAHYKDQINVSAREHMSCVDCFEGSKARRGVAHKESGDDQGEDLPTIHPVVDGRLKDEGRS